MSDQNSLQGSLWRRWDPHIHAPGTILSDNYPNTDQGWEDWLTRVETAIPKVEGLGVTDYYVLDSYEKVRSFQKQGRLNDVFVFPNIELRLGIGVSKSASINFHLLISPEDPDHIQETKRFFRSLTFKALDNVYHCVKDDLIKLGKDFAQSHGEGTISDVKALEHGANQFKVNFEEFRKAWKDSAWIRENALVAVAASSKDGTAGLSTDASQTTLREEIEKFAHIIFSSNPKCRDFWLGEGVLTIKQLRERYRERKPCLHGSDAHKPDDVAVPDENRFSWIKGDPVFETLKQAAIEPTRAFVGETSLEISTPSQTISKINITPAPWFQNPTLPLNPGLVCIIGARGSGKTALADLIAAGGYSIEPYKNDRSFIQRAGELISSAVITLDWRDAQQTKNGTIAPKLEEDSRVQYLSQQFVDQLCSSDGLTSELLEEVERVIFEAHPRENRLAAINFRELLDKRASRSRNARRQQEEELQQLSAEINDEIERQSSLPKLKKKKDDLTEVIRRQKKDRQAFVSKGNKERAAELDVITRTAEDIQVTVDKKEKTHQALLSLKDEVTRFYQQVGPRYSTKLKEGFPEADLSQEEWGSFSLNFVGDVKKILKEKSENVEKEIKELRGIKPFPVVSTEGEEISYIPVGKLPKDQSLALLQAEIKRLEALVGMDRERAFKLKQLTENLRKNEVLLGKLDEEIKRGEKSADRIKDLRDARKMAYQEVFKAIIEEEEELASLYEPLKDRLQKQKGSLKKLTFEVRRMADVESWAQEGEALLDLRKMGPFKGKGSLLSTAKKALQAAWEHGNPEEIATAVATFVEANEKKLKDHAPVEPKSVSEYRLWAAKVSNWLYRSSHIHIKYGIQYDGIDIEQVSPGTRGIVLLLLYLAIDQEDLRPLIIDQPEENLDPKSIFDELVGLFEQTKQRRQIIIVTHNANLVVNTDADQVIVASCGPHKKGTLPVMTYESGGLENSKIRRQVCEILEGGEIAFKDRARRLRVKFSE